MSKLKPIGPRVLIESIAVEKVTSGGIIIPNKALEGERSNKGLVVSVSDEVKNIKVNDTLFYNKYTGAEIELGDKKYIILKVEDIYAIVK